MVTILMMSEKRVAPGLCKIKVFWKKDYDIIISAHDDSNYIVDVVMSPRFGKSSISMREVIITSILWGVDQKTAFLEGWPCFKFNNLRLALGTNLKFYTSVGKEWKLKLRKFWGLIPMFVENTGGKLVGGIFCTLSPPLPPPPPNLNRVNIVF